MRCWNADRWVVHAEMEFSLPRPVSRMEPTGDGGGVISQESGGLPMASAKAGVAAASMYACCTMQADDLYSPILESANTLSMSDLRI